MTGIVYAFWVQRILVIYNAFDSLPKTSYILMYSYLSATICSNIRTILMPKGELFLEDNIGNNKT